MSSTRRIVLIVIALCGLALFGVNRVMSILDKAPLSGTWKDRFQDVSQLNGYAKANPVDLENVIIENKNIDGAVINKGLFKDTDWKQVSAKGCSLTNVVFRDGLLENVNFNASNMTNVVFEDVTLRGVRFVNATLRNVRFIHCTLNGLNIDQTIESQIEINRSRVINTSLSDGQLIAVVKNSVLTKETSLTDLKEPSSLTFEKSDLDGVNMDRSKLKNLIVDGGDFDTTLKVGSVDIIRINNATVDASFSATTIGNITVKDSVANRLILNRSKIHSLSVKNCSKMNDLVMYEAEIGSVDIQNCPLTEFYPAATNIGEMSIKDCKISKGIFERMKANTLALENVSLSGEIDFSKSHIKNFKSRNIIKNPGTKLITDGSNVKL